MNKSGCTLFFQAVFGTENKVAENITKFNILIAETYHRLSEKLVGYVEA